MTNSDKNRPIDSVLTVKAADQDNLNIDNDLSMPIGKSIAELLYDEENNKKENIETTEKDNQETKEKTT